MATQHRLRNGQTLAIRDVTPDDAGAVLQYVEAISSESDFLSFGPGEFGHSEDEERQEIRGHYQASNRFFIAGCIDDAFVSLLTFRGGHGIDTPVSLACRYESSTGGWASLRQCSIAWLVGQEELKS